MSGCSPAIVEPEPLLRVLPNHALQPEIHLRHYPFDIGPLVTGRFGPVCVSFRIDAVAAFAISHAVKENHGAAKLKRYLCRAIDGAGHAPKEWDEHVGG